MMIVVPETNESNQNTKFESLVAMNTQTRTIQPIRYHQIDPNSKAIDIVPPAENMICAYILVPSAWQTNKKPNRFTRSEILDCVPEPN
jgi:hypothetical protein